MKQRPWYRRNRIRLISGGCLLICVGMVLSPYYLDMHRYSLFAAFLGSAGLLVGTIAIVYLIIGDDDRERYDGQRW